MNLRECYDGVKALSPSLDIEPFEIVEEVARIRQFWRPEIVRVVLLAESHVYTHQEDFIHPWSIQNPPYRGNLVRFVYCLAYGESSLAPSVSHNSGTSQFWKIFFSCLHQISTNKDFGPIMRSTSTDERIASKISLLTDMKRAGVWLMDASVVGINRLENLTLRRRVLQNCWDYTYSTLQELNPKPSHIIIIGCFVKRALKREIDSLGIKRVFLPQPQAHIAAPGYHQFYDVYYQVCSRSGVGVEEPMERSFGCKE
jgi:hypothetical protein